MITSNELAQLWQPADHRWTADHRWKAVLV